MPELLNENKNNDKVLLHACCAICAGYPIEHIRALGFEPVIYFYNPNIFPESEYSKRLDALVELCCNLKCELIQAQYNPESFNDVIKGHEKDKEGGGRCVKCFEFRLTKTAEAAIKLKIPTFTTTLPVSPHKDFEKIKRIGKSVSIIYGADFLPINFKKNDGFIKTMKIAKELDLYRQNYCGCEFSIRAEG